MFMNFKEIAGTLRYGVQEDEHETTNKCDRSGL